MHDTTELCAVCRSAARHLAVDFHRSRSGQGRNLGCYGLAIRGDACIAINHAVIMHRTCAPDKGNDSKGFFLVRNS